MAVSDWSTTAASNTTLGALAVTNSQTVDKIDDIVRELMAQLATARDDGSMVPALQSTDTGAAAGPLIDLDRNSSSPATNDILGEIIWNGRDSGGNKQEFASVQTVIVDPTDASEDAQWQVYAVTAGTRTFALGVGGGDIAGGAVATASDQEAGTAAKIVTTAVQHRHPSAAKFWIEFNGTGTVAINASYNVTSLTDNGVGNYTVGINTDFSSNAYAPYGMSIDNGAGTGSVVIMGSLIAAGTLNVYTVTPSTLALADSNYVSVGGFGDQ